MLVLAGALAAATSCNGDHPKPNSPSQGGSDPTSELTGDEVERLRRILDACPGLEDMDPRPIPPDVAHEVLPIPDPDPAIVCPMLRESLP